MARRKNTRRFDPRYFMDEKTDIIKEGFTTTGPDPSKALSQQQIEAIIKLKGMDWWKKAGPHINGENIFDFLDPAYASEIVNLQERLSPESARNAIEFARKIADTIRQQGGKMHAGDLMDHGVSGQEIRNFIGAIQLDPTVGQLEQGRPDGAKVVLQGDRELAVVEAA